MRKCFPNVDWESTRITRNARQTQVSCILHFYNLRQSFDNLRWVGKFIEIAKMSAAGDLTHDRTATLKKLHRILGCRMTAADCNSVKSLYVISLELC